MKKFIFIFPLLFILGLSYLRYTYVINPNLHGDPILISIGQMGWSIKATSLTNIKSILIFWALFLLGNAAFFTTIFKSKKYVKAIVIFYLLISFFSGLFFGLDYLGLRSITLFNLASILKNFLLSPIFTGIVYIVFKYFHWFGKTS